jgi:hypothetical protein
MAEQNIYDRVCVAADILGLLVKNPDDVKFLAMFNVYIKQINECIQENPLSDDMKAYVQKLKLIMFKQSSLIPDELTYNCTQSTLLKML